MTSLGSNGSVEFRFFRPNVAGVSLAADFNNWSRRMPMRRGAQGWWTLELQLEPGEYRFRYIADGQWYTDFASHGVEAGEHGWNSVLVVPGDATARPEEALKVA